MAYKVNGLSESDVLDLADHAADRRATDLARALVTHACPGISDAEIDLLPLGSRDRALLRLRAATFGSAMELVADCPNCPNLLEIDVETDALIVRDPSARSMARLRRMTVAERRLVMRPVTVADIAAALGAECDDPRAVLAARCCTDDATGDAVDGSSLDDDALTAIAARLAKLDPQADLMLDVACVACGHRWQQLFDIAGFFWREIRIRAGILIGEVHDLARALHWSERDILSLSARRRNAYLALVR